jgi:two-component system sensor histidine kinase/response regulator
LTIKHKPFTIQNNLILKRVSMLTSTADMRHASTAAEYSSELTVPLYPIFHHAPGGMAICDLKGQIQKINNAFAKMLAYEPAELEGKNMAVITFKDDIPESKERIIALSQGQVEDDSFELFKRYIHKDPEHPPIWSKTSVSLVRDANGSPEYLIAQMQDITAERLASEEMRQLNHTVLQTSTDPILCVQAGTGKIIDWNPALVKLTGYTDEEIRTMTLFDLVAEDSRDLLTQALKDFKEKGFLHNREYSWRSKDGREIPISVNNRAVYDANGQVRFGVSNVRDMTEEVRHREEVNDLLQIAKKADASMTSYLRHLVHEIRGALSGVVSTTALMDPEKQTADELKEYTAIQKESGEHVMTILNDVLDFETIRSGNLKLATVPFPFNKSHEMPWMKVKAEEKGLDFQFDMDSRIPLWLVGDCTRLKQVLINLANNALKFTKTGSVTILISLIEQTEETCTIKASVKDTGIGMSPEQCENLFQEFGQADASIHEQFGGTGLGLAISQAIVKAMGSRIIVSSTKGTGSCFSFTLNMPIASEVAIQQAIGLTSPPPAETQWLSKAIAAKYRVLLVEDHPINQKVSKRVLENLGFEGVVVAASGEEAIDIAKSQTFDVILMDLNLGLAKMTGIEATESLRTSGCTAQIIAQTGDAFDTTERECISAGMCAHLPKPFTKDVLHACLQKHLPQKSLEE